jgi:DNA-binding response OmpR family regulator
MLGHDADATGYVLIVEDDDALCELLTILVSEEGYDVQCVSTATRGLDLARQRPPSLVLVDLILPDMSGEQFVTELRALRIASAPVIALSGHPNLEQEAARIGADGYLSKPFELEDVLATVRSFPP